MKYYQPKITEFYVGFEYQEYQRKEWDKMIRPPDNLGYEWVTKTFNTSTSLSKIKNQVTGANGMDLMLDGVDQEHPSCKIRVKYLDKQDIEEVLQVKQLKGDDYELNFQIQIENLEDFYEIDYDTDDNKLTVELWKEVNNIGNSCFTLFLGKIKNKSEFKKLLTQLEITIY